MRSVLQQNTAYIEQRSVPDRLAELDGPVMGLFGSADPRWDPESAHQYDVVPNASVEVLADVGHFPMLEAPGEVSTRLLAFTALHQG
jgi:pimeloyl-ACP methyl ester carboxylesterase